VRTQTPTSTERVAGSTCDEVIDALALVLALAIDPEAASPTPPTPTKPARTESAQPTRAPPPIAVDARAPSGPRWSLAAAFRAGVTGAVTPVALPTLGASVEVAVATSVFASAPSRRSGLRTSPSIIAPSVSAFLRHGAAHDLVAPLASTVSFDWTSGGLQLCALRLTLNSLELRLPCVEGEAGVLRAVGGNLVTPGEASRAWVDVGASVGLRWTPFSPIFVLVDGGALFPLTRDRFHIDGPDVTVHDVPPAAGRVEGALGVRFL
jgi:hypothetical protein